jgi:hypothetical protein
MMFDMDQQVSTSADDAEEVFRKGLIPLSLASESHAFYSSYDRSTIATRGKRQLTTIFGLSRCCSSVRKYGFAKRLYAR